MEYLLWTLAGFLSGSVLYASLIPRHLCHVDICALSDDGNPGTANAFKYGGFFAGCLVILCELLKAFFPVYLAAGRLDMTALPFALVIAAPVAGHAFSIFHKGKGGKAIAAAFGAVLALFPNLTPFAALAFFYILFSVVIVVKPHLFRSILSFFAFTAAVFATVPFASVRTGCSFISLITISKHLQSRRRLKARSCDRLSEPLCRGKEEADDENTLSVRLLPCLTALFDKKHAL